MGRRTAYRDCNNCGGTGTYLGKKCFVCNGTGIQKILTIDTNRPTTMRYRECRTCGGTGNYMGRICPACDGKGVAILDISEDY